MAKKVNKKALLLQHRKSQAKIKEKADVLNAKVNEEESIIEDLEDSIFRDFLRGLNLSHEDAEIIISQSVKDKVCNNADSASDKKESIAAEVPVQAEEANITEKKEKNYELQKH